MPATNHSKTNNLERSFSFERSAVNEEARTVELAFSSAEPYERWYGPEILSHAPGAVRLDRLNNGGAVLVDHDWRDQVGVVESARIDSDGVGRATVRFSRSTRGEEMFQDIVDGIRQLVSVGYRIHEKTERELGHGITELTATDWEPHEVSIVAVPADTTVGVGRNHESHEPAEEQSRQTSTVNEGKTMTDTIEQVEETRTESQPDTVDREAELNRIRTAETERVDNIRAQADRHGADELARTAISEGWSYEKFNTELLSQIGQRNNEVRRENPVSDELGLSRNEVRNFSFVRLMDALANPQDRSAQQRAGLELEISDAAVKRMGGDFKARGAYVPLEVLSRAVTLTAGTATDGAELVATNLQAGSFIDVLRNAMVSMQLGVRMIPGLVGDVAIPRKSSASSAGWISAEDGTAAQSEPQFDQITLAPKDLAAYTEVSRRLLQQSTPAIDGIVTEDLAVAIGLGLDSAVYYGSGSSGQPTGIANTSGINTTTFSAADPTFAELVAMKAAVMNDNALTGTPAWVIEANGWEALSTTGKQASGVEGNFILRDDNDRLVGSPYAISNQLTAEDYFFGDFSQVLVGEWGGIELNVDPYTNSLRGRVRYVIFKTCDIGVRQPTAFCYSNDG